MYSLGSYSHHSKDAGRSKRGVPLTTCLEEEILLYGEEP